MDWVMSLPEQLMLVAVDPSRRTLRGTPTVYLAMAGGVVLDLLEGGLAAVEDGKVRVARGAASALPAPMQEQAVAAIAADKPRDVKHWVRFFGAPKFRLGQQVSAALTHRGVLHVERVRRFGLFPTTRYVLAGFAARDDVVVAARAALESSAPPPARMGEFLALAGAGGLIDQLVDPSQRKAARRRVADLTSGVPTAGAVSQVAAQVQAEVIAAASAATIAASTAATN
jgi:hypothetical protein